MPQSSRIVSDTKRSWGDKPLANDTLKLTDQKVLEHAREGLREHLPVQAEGYACTTDDLLNVLVGVAANRGTIESVCTDLVGTPDPETIRGYFNEQLCPSWPDA